MDALSKAILEIVEPKLNESIEKLNLKEMVKGIVEEVAQNTTKRIEISVNGGESVKVGLVHNQFENLLKMVSVGANVLMVGMAGTGKTHGAMKSADILGLKFHSISIGMQTTKSDILGFVDANGRYNESAFYKAFKHGGLFLMDEIDAGNPNVLILVNSAISNGFCEFPNGEMIVGHESFRFIGTANTFGNGSDAVFVGRNQLDLATLDRFCTINWDIDFDIEDALINDKQWLEIGRKAREVVQSNIDNSFITQRALLNGFKLLSAGLDINFVIQSVLLKGFDMDSKNMILSFIEKDVKAYKVIEKPIKKEVKKVIEEPKVEPKEEVIIEDIVVSDNVKEDLKNASITFGW